MKLRFSKVARKSSQILNLVLVFGFLIGGLVLSGYLFPQESMSLSGRARASDGDSIRIADQRIRLLGIDAPELDQTCLDSEGATWFCGQRARQRLAQLLGSGPVNCLFDVRDKFGRALAVCKVEGQDIGAIMVREGLAISYNDYPEQEAFARAGKVGIWSGEFVSPRAWRDGVRQHETSGNVFGRLWDWFTR